MTDNNPTQTDALKEKIAPVLGRIPSGVFILTAGDGDGQETGMLSSWVQQVSFEPPMFSVAVNEKRYLIDWLKKSPDVVLNYVGETQFDFLKHFGKGFEPDQPAFEGIDIERSTAGIPIIKNVFAYLEGRVTSQMTAGDHVLFLIEIINAGASDQLETEKPMVHIRKNGFGY